MGGCAAALDYAFVLPRKGPIGVQRSTSSSYHYTSRRPDQANPGVNGLARLQPLHERRSFGERSAQVPLR